MSEDNPKYEVGQRRMKIEPKYDIDIDTCRIVNRVSGIPIPEDEPVMLFRGQDCFVPDMLARYFLALPSATAADLEHRLAVVKRLEQICAWQAENPIRVKKPDTVIDEHWG